MELNGTGQTPWCRRVVTGIVAALSALWEAMSASYCNCDVGGVAGRDWELGFDFFLIKTEEFIDS